MAIDWQAIKQAGGIGKGPSRYDTKKAKQAEAEKTEREVYAAVTVRDESCCRVCGKYCHARAVSLLLRAHHHHIVYRSRGGKTDTTNICLLCASCHDDEHKGKLQLSGDADARDAGTGRLCGLKIERPAEDGWTVVGWR